MKPDFGWVNWARKLSHEQSESWKQRADLIRESLPPGPSGERLEASLEAAWREMTRSPVDPPKAHQSAGYAVVDLETGGLDPQSCGIVQVGIALLDVSMHETGRFQRIVRPEPGKVYTQSARSVHGISETRQRAEGVPLPEVLAEIKTLLEGRIWVGHNASFDVRFLRACGLYHSGEVVCTLSLARKLLPGPHDLQSLAKRLGIDAGKAHDALGDVLTTADVFRKLTAMKPQG